MRFLKSLLVIFTLVGSAPVLLAVTGDTVSSIPCPYNYPQGLSFDGEYLWNVDRKTDMIYKIDPADGKLLDSLKAPGYNPRGLAWDGQKLWLVDAEENLIFGINPKTRITENTIYCPVSKPYGLTFDGTYLWVADDGGDELHRIDRADGTTIKSLKAPTSHPWGLAFDGTYLWVSDRYSDKIYQMTVDGTVINFFDSPGKHTCDLAWDGKFLWNADYQSDRIFKIKIRDVGLFSHGEERRQNLNFIFEARNFGPDSVKTLDIYLAVPVNMNNQELLGEPQFTPAPTEIITDRWGQKVAHYRFTDLPASETREVSMTVDAVLYQTNYFIFPDKVGTLADIPKDTLDKYLVDDSKYSMSDPIIQDGVKKAVGDEKNAFWIARKIFNYVINQVEYELAGGWNLAPTVLDRGTGSCSEYSFVYISMCRAAGLPARYVGAVTVRGDDASADDVFHRWVEVYLPGYGWITVDPSGGDSEWPSGQAKYFGCLDNRYLITTSGGGGSEYLEWGYNANARWTSKGRCKLVVEYYGEWSPLEKESE
ncbi:MAG: transglutaminase [candidate division Zixibacteria bacterium]|nr:transglutaminase [candidate division Zixibacteria bacterium]